MNFQFYLEKLFGSKEFEKFKKENPKAYLCSGFFSIDKEGQDNKQHLDFYVPSLKKAFSFQFDKGNVTLIPLEAYAEGAPGKLRDNINLDFDEIEMMILTKMEKEKTKNKIQKLLYSLQNKDGKNLIFGTIFLSKLSLLSITIDLDQKEITEFKPRSFFDFMKIIRK